MPLPDDEFDNIYSVVRIEHIEKHHAFLVMQELKRILKPGGHATLELLSVHHRARGADMGGRGLAPRQRLRRALAPLLQL